MFHISPSPSPSSSSSSASFHKVSVIDFRLICMLIFDLSEGETFFFSIIIIDFQRVIPISFFFFFFLFLFFFFFYGG